MTVKEPVTKKEKQRKKNKRDWIIFTQVREQLDKVDIGAPEVVHDAPPPPKAQAAEPGYEAAMQKLVTRNQVKRRRAKDKWNRFAGTDSSAGARGR